MKSNLLEAEGDFNPSTVYYLSFKLMGAVFVVCWYDIQGVWRAQNAHNLNWTLII